MNKEIHEVCPISNKRVTIIEEQGQVTSLICPGFIPNPNNDEITACLDQNHGVCKFLLMYPLQHRIVFHSGNVTHTIMDQHGQPIRQRAFDQCNKRFQCSSI